MTKKRKRKERIRISFIAAQYNAKRTTVKTIIDNTPEKASVGCMETEIKQPITIISELNKLAHSRPDLVLINKKTTSQLVNFAFQ